MELIYCWFFRQKKLPSIEEAWALPIPAELTSRQGQGAITQVRHTLDPSPDFFLGK